MSQVTEVKEQKVNNNEAIKNMVTKFKEIKKKWLDGEIGNLVSATASNVVSVHTLTQTLHKQKEFYDELKQLCCDIKLLDGDLCANIASDDGCWQTICDWFTTHAQKIAEHFSNEIASNMGAECTQEYKEKIVTEVKNKVETLHKECNNEAFKKAMDRIHRVYIAGSVVCLILSWAYILETAKEISEASDLIASIKGKLEKLRKNKIKPIIAFVEKALGGNRIKKNEYENYQSKIDQAVELINEWKDQIEKEKQRMKRKGFNNALSAGAMVGSSITSFGMNGGKIMKAVGTLQGVTAGLHVFAAMSCAEMFRRLHLFKTTLKQEIAKIEQVETDLKDCYKRRNDNSRHQQIESVNFIANAWNNKQVVEWVKKIHPSYKTVAKIFEEEGVEGADLLDMDSETLDSYGVKLCKQKQLLRNINGLITAQ
eukprot:105290_1